MQRPHIHTLHLQTLQRLLILIKTDIHYTTHTHTHTLLWINCDSSQSGAIISWLLSNYCGLIGSGYCFLWFSEQLCDEVLSKTETRCGHCHGHVRPREHVRLMCTRTRSCAAAAPLNLQPCKTLNGEHKCCSQDWTCKISMSRTRLLFQRCTDEQQNRSSGHLFSCLFYCEVLMYERNVKVWHHKIKYLPSSIC